MNSFKKSCLFAGAKTAAVVFMFLPINLGLWIGRCLGHIGYCCLGKKRAVVYANLKTVFAGERSPSELRTMTRDVFINFAQSFVELLCLPRINRMGMDRFVQLEGKEHFDQALALGRGVIFLAVHSGSWELASIVAAVTKRAYHIVANDQSKMPELDTMLNEYRRSAGADVIFAKTDTKDIIKALKNNEIISIVLDQGGREGLVMPFLGKTSSLSTGGIRLALKYGTPICPVWIQRQAGGKHTLSAFPAMPMVSTGDLDKDIAANMLAATAVFEPLIRQHPQEYLWFYKVFKYSNQKQVVIIDDGRRGHLRQAQSVARTLTEVLKKKGQSPQERTVSLQWRNPAAVFVFSCYVYLSQYFAFLRREDCLKYFLTEFCYKDLMSVKADFVVSCGSQAAGINFIISRNHLAKSISILTPGLLSLDCFNVVALQEDAPGRAPRHAALIKFKVAPNLIDPAYLKEQTEGLLKHYSHLKGNARTKLALLIGGDTKGVVFDEVQIRQLIAQIKQSALQYNADILVTTSRRTPASIEQIILKEFKNWPRCPLCIIANQRNIPEAVGGVLGLSDLIIVSGESISMVSESLCSGKPTIVFSAGKPYAQAARDKYEDFALKLNDQRYLMVSKVTNLSENIAQLLNRKITLKTLDNQDVIQRVLETIA